MSRFKFAPALSGIPMQHQGKTRDTFPIVKRRNVSSKLLLIVGTSRLSTHDVIHTSVVPSKGEVLTALTIFWLKDVLESDGIRHHLVAYGARIYDYLPGSRRDYPPDLHHRAIIVKHLRMLPIEFVYRAYLAGSLWKKFYSKGLPNPYGIPLEPGLPIMSPFENPVFTPTEKSETDDPLDTVATRKRYSLASALTARTFDLARVRLNASGIELVDSKFEVGVDEEGQMCLADEVATPDSSRFCELSHLTLGVEPPWLDKQIARDVAEKVWGDGPKTPLEFDSAVIQKLSETYRYIFWGITGVSLHEFQQQRLD